MVMVVVGVTIAAEGHLNIVHRNADIFVVLWALACFFFSLCFEGRILKDTNLFYSEANYDAFTPSDCIFQNLSHDYSLLLASLFSHPGEVCVNLPWLNY